LGVYHSSFLHFLTKGAPASPLDTFFFFKFQFENLFFKTLPSSVFSFWLTPNRLLRKHIATFSLRYFWRSCYFCYVLELWQIDSGGRRFADFFLFDAHWLADTPFFALVRLCDESIMASVFRWFFPKSLPIVRSLGPFFDQLWLLHPLLRLFFRLARIAPQGFFPPLNLD